MGRKDEKVRRGGRNEGWEDRQEEMRNNVI